MDELISFNSRILPAGEISISALSSAALYGKGIFTTVAVYDGNPFIWTKHWQRLVSNAAASKIKLSDLSEETIRNSLDEIIRKNTVEYGRARITIFDESSTQIWPFQSGRTTSLLITTAAAREIPDTFRLTVSPYQRNTTSPLAGIKSCNYLEQTMALDEAKNRGFDEAVCLNERGEIASAVMANLFWLKDGNLFTPSLKTGCLAGTTRAYLMENIECFEVQDDVRSVRNADAVFLTSAGIGVLRAAEIDGKKQTVCDHPALDILPKRN